MKILASIAALLGLLGVALGAFGAHGLKDLVAPHYLDVWKTAVSYQMYHVPVVLMLTMMNPGLGCRLRVAAVACFLVGMAVFSGTLYALVWFDMPWLGMITPAGGTLLMVGWLLLLVAVLSRNAAPTGE